MKLYKPLFFFFFFINLVSLYFIIVLFGYDEIVGHLSDGQITQKPLRGLAYLFYVTTLSNLYFVAYLLIKEKFE